MKNRHSGKSYTDNLCALRCLAQHRGHDIKSIEGPAQDFYKQWSDQPIKEFEGLNFEDFPTFKKLFFVNLEVYNLTEDGFAHSVYISRGQQGSTIYVNLYQNHLSYIRDFAIYAKKCQCKTCERHFDRSFILHQHKRSCDKKMHFVYPGGFYQSTESIFEKLEQYDINVRKKSDFFPWYICYDPEALLEPVDDCPTVMLQWTQKHVPVSVSICSKKLSSWLEEKAREDDAAEFPGEKNHSLRKLYGQFEGYMSQVPVLGFNSAGTTSILSGEV